MQLMASETTNEGNNQTGFSKTVIEFCSNTSAHGLGGVANSSSRKGRLLWLCIVLVAFGVCFQGSFKLIERFLKFDVSVDVITVREQSLRFPAITICNMNRFKKSKILGTKLDNITVSMRKKPCCIQTRVLDKAFFYNLCVSFPITMHLYKALNKPKTFNAKSD